ncbi:uncharacterized protein LOC108114112 [Drosophila eugracilis]|uniref:uncharacterized protein LOC108114112 n=1 Tax=Drosophila eugracilis TaxID=29029 RepID=UPI001BDA82FB|nr:uncharacterized protein LOC108114112 [Drosophila eugracilis]
MIRASLLVKLNRSVVGSLVNNWDNSKLPNVISLNPRAVNLIPARCFSAGGDDEKPKKVPPGFVAPLGSNPENTTRKGVATSEVQTPAVSVVTSGGKIGRTVSLDTNAIVRNKGTEEKCSGDDKKSDAQKRAMEAKEAAAKQVQEIMANMPSRQQTEKYFFRVVAFIYDLSYLTATWLVNFIEHNIVQNPTVQHYWKRFHEKMEQAKKD